MNLSHVILYAIVPIIVVMLAGYLSGKKGVFTGDDAKKFNKVVLDYAPSCRSVCIYCAGNPRGPC